MKVYVNLLLFTAFVEEAFVRRILPKLKALGADGVEVPLFQGSVKHYEKIGRVIRNQGLDVSTVATVNAENDPSSLDEKVRRAGVVFLKERIDWATALGARILCGPLVLPWGVRPLLAGDALVNHIEQRMGFAVESLAEAVRYAKEGGIHICNEYLVGYELPGCNRIDVAAALIEGVDQPNFGVLIDTSHETTYGRGRAVFDAAVHEIAAMRRPIWFHVSKTGDRGDFTESWINFRAIFSALKSVGWEGPIVIEIFDAEEPFASGVGINDRPFTDKFALLQKCIAFVREEWEQASPLSSIEQAAQDYLAQAAKRQKFHGMID